MSIETQLIDIGNGIGGLLNQMGSPIVFFMVSIGITTAIAIIFKRIFTEVSS